MPLPSTLSIGEVASRTGLAISAIRYYEEEGLVKPERNTGGQRRFLRSDIRRLSFVLIAQQFGFTIQQIRQQLESLPDGRAPNKRDWTTISKSFRGELDQKIHTLTKLRERLDGCIGCGCLSLRDCQLYNRDDEAAQEGSGPRYLLNSKS